jgi:hypothetical protein
LVQEDETMKLGMVIAAMALIGIDVSIAACDWFNRVDPPISTAPRKGYPCGINGLVCVGADSKPTKMCCDQGEVCGGAFPNAGCPAGECCDELIGANRHNADAAKGEHPQRRGDFE